MKLTKTRVIAVGVVVLASGAGVLGLSGVAGASDTFDGFLIVFTHVSMTNSTLNMSGITTPDGFPATVASAGSFNGPHTKFNASTVAVTIDVSGGHCSITLGAMVFRQVSGNNYRAMGTVSIGDYSGTCSTKSTGPVFFTVNVTP